VPPLRRKVLAVETTANAFAYVFAGSGRFINASPPLPVPTEFVRDTGIEDAVPADDRSLILFDRGEDVTALSARLGPAPSGARRLARPYSDEHAR
jgi:hypothetical protein